MRARLAGPVASLVTVAVMATGCSVQENGSPIAESSASSEDETYGAPRVDTPLDATAFLTEPCAVLSQTQLAAFDVSRPGIATTTGATAEYAGPFCTWQDNGSTIGVGFLTGNENGLSDTYRGRALFEYFEPTTVEGYPAVYASSPDLRSSGVCLIAVGISDSLTFNATEQGSLDAQETCDRALQVATAALATLKEGG